MSIGGLSEGRLGRMRDVIAGYVERGVVPGLGTLIGRRGEVQVDAIGTKSVGGRVRYASGNFSTTRRVSSPKLNTSIAGGSTPSAVRAVQI
jgi:hypothetical protein